jgi:uncharacterized protein
MLTPPRYCPTRPLPGTAYVPGRTARPAESLVAGDADSDFRYAADLFNHGYYWEAHEVWEQLWVAAGRQGADADLLKGLIKLAAAGVKCRQGQIAGVRRHALRAAELLAGVRDGWSGETSGIVVSRVREELIHFAEGLARAPHCDTRETVGGLRVREWCLRLEGD